MLCNTICHLEKKIQAQKFNRHTINKSIVLSYLKAKKIKNTTLRDFKDFVETLKNIMQ